MVRSYKNTPSAQPEISNNRRNSRCIVHMFWSAGGTGCTSSGSQQIIEALEEIDKVGLTDEVSVVQTSCHGLCAFTIMIDDMPVSTLW